MLHSNRLIALAITAASAALVGSCSDNGSADSTGLWIANPDRLGPITAETAFSQDALAAILPDFSVVEGEAFAEGEAYLTYEAHRTTAGPAVLVVDGNGDQLLAVTIREPGLIQSALDIGMLAGAGGLDPGLCFPGVEERSGDVVCQDERPTGLTYWIRVDHAGPDGEMPPVEALNAGTVYEIQWVPVPG
ncbi:DUF1131 family protein [Maricaulis sp.]|uniref:DUF1131 family protein n=1 Tax=Maricaulis sp. TaxID=1486257 RepID=UPI003A8F5ADF